MTKSSLRKLIKEVLQEVESEEFGKHTAAHEKEYGGMKHPTLVLKLAGLNAKNSHIIKDFIGRLAYEAKLKDIEILNAELENQGKIGFSMDGPEIHKSEKEINAELDAIAAQSGEENELSPDERLSNIKTGEKAGEWQAATAKDAESQKKYARERAAAEKAGTLETDPNTGLPLDTNLWTDKEWELWDTGQKSTGNQSYRKASTKQGRKGMISPGLSDYLRKTPMQYQAK